MKKAKKVKMMTPNQKMEITKMNLVTNHLRKKMTMTNIRDSCSYITTKYAPHKTRPAFQKRGFYWIANPL